MYITLDLVVAHWFNVSFQARDRSPEAALHISRLIRRLLIVVSRPARLLECLVSLIWWNMSFSFSPVCCSIFSQNVGLSQTLKKSPVCEAPIKPWNCVRHMKADYKSLAGHWVMPSEWGSCACMSPSDYCSHGIWCRIKEGVPSLLVQSIFHHHLPI